MIPRLNIIFPIRRQSQYWLGEDIDAAHIESDTLDAGGIKTQVTSGYTGYLLNHARTGIVMALKASVPEGSRVGVVAYNCHTVVNSVVNARCTPVFVDVTDDLKIDIDSVPRDLDAIVVTNLFGIRNDIEGIQKRCPKAIVIVDNAHGYGLPAEGDFTVYSINQGKFPSLGEGGMLYAMDEFKLKMDDLYAALPSYSFMAQVKLFVQMWVKAVAYGRCFYWWTKKMKNSSSPKVHQEVVMKKMAPGIRRLYKAWLPSAEKEIETQRKNAVQIDGAFYGDNAFMAIVKSEDPNALQKQYAKRGVETATHFKTAITWAEEFGYKRGSCPKAEELTQKLLMIPTYTR